MPYAPKTSLRHRALWSLADQVVSSGTNFLMLIMVIRNSSTDEVGSFSLAYLTFFLLLALVRGVALEPLVVRYSRSNPAQWQQGTRDATGLALTLSFCLGAVLACVGLGISGATGQALVALSIFLPGLLVQDAWRLAFFCIGKPKMAFLNDLLCLTLQVIGYLMLILFDHLTVTALIAVWGGAALCSAAVGSTQAGVTPAPRSSRRWLREHSDIGPSFAADAAINRGAEHVAMLCVGFFGGLAALGSVTAARTLFAPLTTLQSGLSSFALPEVARLHQSERRQEVRRLTWLIGSGMALLMLAAGLILYLVPEEVGATIFQENWTAARSILPAMATFSALNALAYGIWVGLRGCQVAKPTLYARGVGGAVTIGTTSAGALLTATEGATWGMAVGAAATVGLLAPLFRAETRRHPRTQVGRGGEPEAF